MYICVLTSVPDENDPPYDPSPHMTGFNWKHYLVDPNNVESQLLQLMDEGVDVFVNLCDGTPDDPLSGIELVSTMERIGAAFTGADSTFFDPTREEMKAAARRAGVPAPKSGFVHKMEDVEKATRRLRYPVLVKPLHGFASMGIKRESRVENIEQLKIQVEQTIKEFGGALLEEFIEGREFTCLVAENPENPNQPISIKPVEFVFPEGETFKHYDMKWVDYEQMSVKPVDDPRIEKTLREQTMKMFQALHGNGYARCDYRMDSTGTIYMLEINPNCGIFYHPSEPGSADYSLMNDPKYNHHKFMNLIIRSGIKQRDARMVKQLEFSFA